MDDLHLALCHLMPPQHVCYHLVHAREFPCAEHLLVVRHLLFNNRYNLWVAAEFSERKSLHKSLGHQFHDVVVIPQVFVVALAGFQADYGAAVERSRKVAERLVKGVAGLMRNNDISIVERDVGGKSRVLDLKPRPIGFDSIRPGDSDRVGAAANVNFGVGLAGLAPGPEAQVTGGGGRQ